MYVDLTPVYILFFLAVVVLWLAIQNYKNVKITGNNPTYIDSYSN